VRPAAAKRRECRRGSGVHPRHDRRAIPGWALDRPRASP